MADRRKLGVEGRKNIHPKVLWDAWNMNNFYFLFLLFSNFTGILFSFSFYFGQ